MFQDRDQHLRERAIYIAASLSHLVVNPKELVEFADIIFLYLKDGVKK